MAELGCRYGRRNPYDSNEHLLHQEIFQGPGRLDEDQVGHKASDQDHRILRLYRDKKMAVISEALQGIRQIKFSALEDKWENRIRGVREEELDILKKVFIADTAVISVWM